MPLTCRSTDASIEQRTYDPDKAKFHLKKAGLDTLSVSLSTSDSLFAGAVDSVTLYREQAAKAGIDVEIRREPGDGYWSDVWLRKPFVTSAWGARPVPDMIFSTAYGAGGAWNETKFDNARFMELLQSARSELYTSKRQELYSEMQRIVRDEGGTIVPFFRNLVYARRAAVGRPDKIASNWDLDGYRGARTMVFCAMTHCPSSTPAHRCRATVHFDRKATPTFTRWQQP